MPVLGEEQREIIETIKRGKSVLCDAVAGSGKTTTVIWLAKKCPNKMILQLTFNKLLKAEVREKIKEKSLKNIDIHNYNSLAKRYYHKMAYEGQVVEMIVEKDQKPIVEIPKYDIVVIDETQDMTPMFYHLVKKFIKDMNKKVKLLILGDRYQGIFDFKGADKRFLTLAPKIWPDHGPFRRLLLSTSYRLTKPIAWFVNNVMLGYERIKSARKGYPITYIRGNIFMAHVVLVPEILKFLKKGYKPGDIFVLAGSVKNIKSPIYNLENALVAKGIECYVPTSDEAQIDNDVINGKVTFTTFHQAKGRERKIVIIYGFDNGYFKYYGRDYPEDKCPSTLYVGATRASEKLFLVENSENGPLNFLKKSIQELTKTKKIKIIGHIDQTAKKEDGKIPPGHNTSPTDLARYLSEESENIITPLVNELFEIETVAKKSIDIPCKIKSASGKYEEVSDLNGLVIPAMYQTKLTGGNTLMEFINLVKKDPVIKSDEFLIQAIKKIKQPCKTLGDYLYLGNVYVGVAHRLHHKIEQIDNYNWLTKEMVEQCHKNMSKYIGEEAVYEQKLDEYVYVSKEFGIVIFNGQVDAFDDKNVWEFKCVTDITHGHLYQVIIYAWLWEKCMKKILGDREFKIINIRTGEIRKLNNNSYLIEEVMQCLLRDKYSDKPPIEDTDFINDCFQQFQPIKNYGKKMKVIEV